MATAATSPQRPSGPSPEGPLARFREYLGRNNLRLTPERRAVLEVILSREGHFDAEELLRFLRRRRRVSRATLYRTLDHLREAGLVKVHRFGRGQALYEHVYGRQHHDHMVCNRCGGVTEFVNEEIERLQEEVCRRVGFHSTSHVMEIYGVCRSCSEQEAASASSDLHRGEPRPR